MPRPTPGRNRPPLSTSSEAISLARITGLRPGEDEHGGAELHPLGAPGGDGEGDERIGGG